MVLGNMLHVAGGSPQDPQELAVLYSNSAQAQWATTGTCSHLQALVLALFLCPCIPAFPGSQSLLGPHPRGPGSPSEGHCVLQADATLLRQTWPVFS